MHIFTKNDKEFIVSKTLKDFDETLDDKNFIRIHKSYLVNKQSITSYIRSNGIKVKLRNGKLLPVSRRKQALFLVPTHRINSNAIKNSPHIVFFCFSILLQTVSMIKEVDSIFNDTEKEVFIEYQQIITPQK